ncbi:F5/8 type C domain protein [Sphingobium phage Lacusarx]|uniref:F5/8 type C domain protein n=1 Tax=Sphingobium phage Lacusarx TaxID=1980139 RepID=A0A1W6DWZ2_9CAUD|nr:tail protein [Sphingobium phage Lacusarx]ARK07424.1 F5/8 type C domain protein [Sphingobium phage Lacusarx]
MPNTPILAIPQLTENQAGKEIVINDAILAIESALGKGLSVSFATASAVTLSVAQITRNFLIKVEGATAACTLTAPDNVAGVATARVFAISNLSNWDCTVKSSSTAADDQVVVPSKQTVMVLIDGTAARKIAASVPNGELRDMTDVDWTTIGNGKVMVWNSATNKFTFVTPLTEATGVPSGGSNGQVLTKVSGATAWANLPESTVAEVPSGGAVNQVLTKTSEEDYAWMDLPPGVELPDFLVLTDTPENYEGAAGKLVVVKADETGLEFVTMPVSLPAGGTEGQVLQRDAAGAAVWGNAPESLPEGGEEGQVLTRAANGDAVWATGGDGGSADYPAFTDNAGKILAVNAAEDGVEWITAPEGGGVVGGSSGSVFAAGMVPYTGPLSGLAGAAAVGQAFTAYADVGMTGAVVAVDSDAGARTYTLFVAEATVTTDSTGQMLPVSAGCVVLGAVLATKNFGTASANTQWQHVFFDSAVEIEEGKTYCIGVIRVEGTTTDPTYVGYSSSEVKTYGFPSKVYSRVAYFTTRSLAGASNAGVDGGTASALCISPFGESVGTGGTGVVSHELPVTNAGGELGTMDGWTVTPAGSMVITSNYGGGSPRSGTYFFAAAAGASSAMSQVIDLSDYANDIDARTVEMDASVYTQTTYTSSERSEFLVEVLGAAGNVLAAYRDQISGIGTMVQFRWNRLSAREWLPAGARSLRVTATSVRLDGTNNDNSFDDFSVVLRVYGSGRAGGSADYPAFAKNAGKVLAVNDAEDGVEWIEPTVAGRVEPLRRTSLFSWDFTKSGELVAGNYDIDVSEYDEIDIIFDRVTKAVSASFVVRFSTDGGVTFDESASYYSDVGNTGTWAYADAALYSSGQSAASRVFMWNVRSLRSSNTGKPIFGNRSALYANHNPVTHVRIVAVSNYTGGAIEVLGVQAAVDPKTITSTVGKHRYWMLKDWTHTQGQSAADRVVGGSALELRATVGGSALPVSAISATDTLSGYPVSNLIDATASTFWCAQYGSNPYIVIDLGADSAVREIAWSGRPDSYYTQSPRGFNLYFSDDGIEWSLAGPVLLATQTAAGQTSTGKVPSKVRVATPVGSSTRAVVETATNLLAADAGNYLRFTAVTAKTLTVQLESVEPQADNSEWHIRNAASANLTVVGASGVTINAPYNGSLIIPPQGTATLKRAAANTYDLMGQTV